MHIGKRGAAGLRNGGVVAKDEDGYLPSSFLYGIYPLGEQSRRMTGGCVPFLIEEGSKHAGKES